MSSLCVFYIADVATATCYFVKVNTMSMEFDSKGINHTEGGWPKDVNHLEVEQVVRYRKKVEKDISYVNVIDGLGTVSIIFSL